MTQAFAEAAQPDRLRRLMPRDEWSDIFLEGATVHEWTWEPDRVIGTRIEERRGLCKRKLGDGRMQMTCEDGWGEPLIPDATMEPACLSPRDCRDAWDAVLRRHPLLTACRITSRQIIRQTAGLNYQLEAYAAARRRTEVTVECGCGTERYRISRLMEHANELEATVEEAAVVVEERMDAATPSSGEWTVVLAAGRTGIFAHEVFGHPAEAGADIPISLQTHPQLRVFDGCDGQTVDDEGIDHREQLIFEDGQFTTRLTDLMSGRRSSCVLTGNGRRQTYHSIPIPRMWRTFIGKGFDQVSVRDVRRGIMVHALEGGQTFAGRAPIQLRILDAQLIERGECTRRIRNGVIHGTAEALASAIAAVGDDLSISRDVTYCGKQGQWIPVSVGGPSLCLKSVEVRF